MDFLLLKPPFPYIRSPSIACLSLTISCRLESLFPPPSSNGIASVTPLISSFSWVQIAQWIATDIALKILLCSPPSQGPFQNTPGMCKPNSRYSTNCRTVLSFFYSLIEFSLISLFIIALISSHFNFIIILKVQWSSLIHMKYISRHQVDTWSYRHC